MAGLADLAKRYGEQLWVVLGPQLEMAAKLDDALLVAPRPTWEVPRERGGDEAGEADQLKKAVGEALVVEKEGWRAAQLRAVAKVLGLTTSISRTLTAPHSSSRLPTGSTSRTSRSSSSTSSNVRHSFCRSATPSLSTSSSPSILPCAMSTPRSRASGPRRRQLDSLAGFRRFRSCPTPSRSGGPSKRMTPCWACSRTVTTQSKSSPSLASSAGRRRASSPSSRSSTSSSTRAPSAMPSSASPSPARPTSSSPITEATSSP